MCGIAGFCDPLRRSGKRESERIVSAMASALRHRGPDDEGTWADPQAGVALGHRRLAILDLSQEGHQPMSSADGRYTLVFNGEIYNFQSLRRELIEYGHSFRGHSDTEVLLAGISQWGLIPALRRSIGMFALGLWDGQSRTLHLARDRAGEKPLYCGWCGDVFLFGSELKALRAHPRWEEGIDRDAVALLVRYGYIPCPYSIYQNTQKLRPGCVLTLTEGVLQARSMPEPEAYWSWQEVAKAGVAQPFIGTEGEATDQLNSLLGAAVGQQMVADVPLGAFLSGGIDSSLVVALMQAHSRRPVRTFCIGFHQTEFDEAPFARAVARHLGTDHTELYVQPHDLLEVLHRLPEIYDEPFADSSQIPTVLLCELARSQVTVSLSGDAGDELFGGYEDYRRAQRLWPILQCIPQPLRSAVARPLAMLADLEWSLPNGSRRRQEALASCASLSNQTGDVSEPPHAGGYELPGHAQYLLCRMSNLARMLPTQTDQELCHNLMSPNRAPLDWLKRKEEPRMWFDSPSQGLRRAGASSLGLWRAGRSSPQGGGLLWEELPDLLHRMMYLDSVAYLPDDILVKVDRAAMSVSLETRIPLLDHRVIQFAWSLPRSLKQRNGCGKWLLRRVLDRYVPRALIERPKKGFNVPVAQWLGGPLRPWAEELLSESRLRQEGFFDDGAVRLKWQQHLEGRRDWGMQLWHALMFQAWLEEQKRPRARLEGAVKSAPASERVELQVVG